MRNPILIEVAEQSAVAEARRAASSLAGDLGFDEEATGRLSLVATELATNLVKHASGGLFLAGREEGHADSVEILALDDGPGIADVAAALRDGHSTSATSGTGLGAVSRMADYFDIYSQPSCGTAIVARVTKPHQSAGAGAIAAVSIPLRGEQVNGDGVAWMAGDGTLSIMVVDGLGHGPLAHQAAVAACVAFRRTKGTPLDRLRTIHEALRPTRGAAAALAELNPDTGELRFAGVGNISATTIDGAARRSAVSVHGIVGHEVRDFRTFSYPWSRQSWIIMHSDGLTTRWDLDRYPALLTRDPALVAGVLWKDHRRVNDDATVVVARTP